MSSGAERLLTCMNDYGVSRLEVDPAVDLSDGEVRLRIDRFALTTNNITYAAYGDAIGYWRVFPTGRPGWGAMPVWGFAEVVQSRAPAVREGVRVWGYLPIAEALVVRADRATSYSFVDATPHRRAVPDVYSRYTFCAQDPHYDPALEACQALYRPLFITSYTAVDFLRSQAFFGASRVLISSASSKTAYGVAWCLQQEGLHLVGLTSERNRAFVEGLGCYGEVMAYDAVEQLSPDVPTLYIDLANSPGLRPRVHRSLGSALVYDCLVGSTQDTAYPNTTGLSGPKPEFFFAAVRLDQHRAQNTLRDFLNRFEADQVRFFKRAVRPDAPWIHIVEQTGFDAAARIIEALVLGRADPAEGHLIRLRP